MRHSLTALIAATSFTVGLAQAAEPQHATKDEAVAMVKKASAHIKSVGRDKAMTDFNQKSGAFVQNDLYIYVSDLSNGKVLAHGANEKLIGRDLTALKDVDGKAFVAELLERAKSGKAGWTDYKWPNPVTKEIEAKTTYCEPADSMVICGGVYK